MNETIITQENILLPSYRGRLLEGLTYNKANNTLLWVDIIAAQVHRVTFEDGNAIEDSHEMLEFTEPGESVGAVMLTKDPDIVLACAKYGVATASFKTKSFNYIFKYPLSAEKAQKLRSNDGIIDPWGNLWIGLMNDFPAVESQGEVTPEGVLYRISASDLSVKAMVKDSYIPNGLAFTEDGKSLIWTDSLTYTVWQFDYDNERVELRNRRPLLETKKLYPEENSPEPDGLAMTAEGDVFQAVFSTSTVIKYDLNGHASEKWKFPAQRITCTGLGGVDDDDLFVTTAHLKLDDFATEIDPFDKSGDLGGFLFRVKLDSQAHSTPAAVWGGKI
ncbi:hypothetical protein OY671_004988 [Metschnikowia pulcherrima]|nr:hypothetical protein OY671_004988 [Metschnikowia pulcherrima]